MRKILKGLKISLVNFGSRFGFLQCHGALIVLSLASACATLSVSQLEDLSPDQTRHFAECCNLEGAAKLEFSMGSGDPGNFSAEADWLGEKIVISDVLGRTLLQISPGEVLAHRGIRDQLTDLDSDAGGRLFWQGNYLGLRIAEFACLLSNRLPHSWASTGVVRRQSGFQMMLSDGRQVTIKFVDNILTAEIRWWRWGIISYRISLEFQSETSGVLKFLGDTSLYWQRI